MMRKDIPVFLFFLLAGVFEPVTSQEQGNDPAKFNEIVKNAARAEERWVAHPITVSLLYIDWTNDSAGVVEYQENITSQSTPEEFADALVTIERSGFLDDSVSGDRYVVDLEKQESAAWLIKSVKYSWRCWKGRGDVEYSNAPCH